MDLVTLQVQLSKHPSCYQEDYQRLFSHTLALLSSIRLASDRVLVYESCKEELEGSLLFLAQNARFFNQEKRHINNSPLVSPGQVLFDLCTEWLQDFSLVESLPSMLRRTLVRCLFILNSGNYSESFTLALESLVKLLFGLFKIKDKQLRSLVLHSLVTELIKQSASNNKTRASIQALLASYVEDRHDTINTISTNLATNSMLTTTDMFLSSYSLDASLNALLILIEMYRKGGQAWKQDSRLIQIIAQAAIFGGKQKALNADKAETQSKNNHKDAQCSIKLQAVALNFFIGRMIRIDEISEEDGEGGHSKKGSGNDQATIERKKRLELSCQVAGKSRAKQRKLARLLKRQNSTRNVGDADSNQEDDVEGESDQEEISKSNPIRLLHDPQGFAEKLLYHLKTCSAPLDHKLLLINVLSRCIGQHKLLLPDFYLAMLRFIHPHQKEVLKVLAYIAQATHTELNYGKEEEKNEKDDNSTRVDNDASIYEGVLYPVLKAIANVFIADHNGDECIAAGINGIRAICARCPDAIPRPLLHELIEYAGLTHVTSPTDKTRHRRRHHDKGVVMAARGLIQLYREKRPQMLPQRQRGREAILKMIAAKNQNRNDVKDGDKEDTEQDKDAFFDPCLDEEILDNSQLARIRSKNGSMTTLFAKHNVQVIDEDEVLDPLSLATSKHRRVLLAEDEELEKGKKEPSLVKHGSKRRGKERASVPKELQAKKNKNALMLVHAPSVRRKIKRSAKEKRRVQRAHKQRQKLKR